MDRKKEVMNADRFYEIDTALERIREVWMAHPELRLGQLLSNVKSNGDLYYIEDEDLVNKVEDFYSERPQLDEKEGNKRCELIMTRDDLLRIAKRNDYDADCNDLRTKLFRGERYTEDVNLIEIAEDVADTLYFSTEKCDEKDLIVFGAAIAYAKTKLEYR